MTSQNEVRHISTGIALAIALIFLVGNATAVPIVDLGTAGNFAVLSGQGITVAGAVNTTTITGDMGTYPNPAITGLGNVVLNGTDQTLNGGVMLQAKNDLTTAYLDAAGRAATTSYGGANQELGGLTLTSGVYNDSSSFGLAGTLTLDAQGNANAVWIFQAGSTLTTASGSTVLLINGADACNVFWQIGSSATLGTDSDFVGNILALTAIALNTGATVDGRVLARNAAVTLDTNTITGSDCNSDSTGGTGGGTGGAAVPDSGSTLLLLGSGLTGLIAVSRRLHPFA